MKDYPNRSKVVRGYMRGMPKLCYPVSSSTILPLNLPPQLRWDWMEVYGLQKDFGIACLICCGLICWPMSRVVYHPWVAWVSSGLRCILNVWDPTYDVCVCGSAILQSLHNERRSRIGPGSPSGSIFSGRSCSPIVMGFYDCMRNAIMDCDLSGAILFLVLLSFC